MLKQKIMIPRNDHQSLTDLLLSKFTLAISPSDYLDSLASELERAEVIEPARVPKDVVTMNSTVTLLDLDTHEVQTYTLVFPKDADIANNRLSVLAPIGTAILGQRVGDMLQWRVPAGLRRLNIVRVISGDTQLGKSQTGSGTLAGLPGGPQLGPPTTRLPLCFLGSADRWRGGS